MARARFGVVGCGSIGKRHIKNLLALGRSDILAFDPREDRRREAEVLGVETTARMEGLWDAGVDAVLVTAPTKMHVEVATIAATHGCHLFIEKPVADLHDEALDRLLEIVRAKKLVNLVGCNMRFHPSLARAKTLLEEGRLGRVVSMRAEFGQYLPDWHPWEDYRQGYSARRDLGGGVVLDAIHELDYARWLMGEIALVAAFTGKLSGLSIDTEDTASIILRFRSGAFGEVHLDYVQRAASRSCTVVGEEGTLVCNLRGKEGMRVFDAATKKWEIFPELAGWDVNEMYLDEMKHFLACLDGEARPAQDVFEAARVLDVALAAKLSSERGVALAPEAARSAA